MLNSARFQDALSQILPDFRAKKFLIAVSGGVDSMVLVHLCIEAALDIEIAHVNYGLRGENSELDEKLVQTFAAEYQIPLHIYKVSEKDNRPEGSIQEWARDLRYSFFKEKREKAELDYILTAHHLNDQLESFLINLSKASGITGLCGIPAQNGKVIRPLLHFTKEALYHYAAQYQVPFREDHTNQENYYLRNKIRNKIVPELNTLSPVFMENFSKSLDLLVQARNFITTETAAKAQELISKNNESVLLNRKEFLALSLLIKYELLQPYNFHSAKEIKKICEAETGKVFYSATHGLQLDREHFIIKARTEEKTEQPEDILILNDSFSLPAEIAEEIKTLGNVSWTFDADTLTFPLKLRKPGSGDVLYPTGMTGKKKISKFFKDEKIPILAQQKIWLLCDATDSLLGILPYRQDRRHQTHKKTTRVYEVKI